MTQLFKTRPTYEPSSHTKTAGTATKLGPDPAQWPAQILQEATKAIPALKDYDPHVMMQETDPESLTAYGALVISSQSDPVQPSPFVRSVHIPVIISEGKMLPLDLLVQPPSEGSPAKTLPLTEKRLRQALFRPDLFDTAADAPPDVSLTNTLFPPSRDGYNGFGAMAGMGKMSSSLFENALGLASLDEVKVARNRILEHKLAFACNPASTPSLGLLAERMQRPDSFSKVAFVQKSAERLPSTIMQITAQADGTYAVKTANHTAWAPQLHIVDRGQLCKIASADVVEKLDDAGNGGEVTINTAKGEEEDAPPPDLKQVTAPGLYRVTTVDGRDLVGLVFPELINLDGESVPLALFTNGSESAFQGEIAGAAMSSSPPSLPRGRPRGYGAFVGRDNDQKLVATVPMEISAGFSDQSADGFVVSTPEGGKGTVKVMPNLAMPTSAGEALLIPASYQWMPLERSKLVTLASPKPPAAKTASVKLARPDSRHVILSCHGENSYVVEGEAVEKLASEERHFITASDAVFLLSALGANTHTIMDKLAEATGHRRATQVKIAHILVPQAEVVAGTLSKVASRTSRSSVPAVNLVKEAAYIPEKSSVDTLLGLGMLSPDNVMAFVQKLPQIEEALQTMCEMLLAARLGLQEIPQSALEKAVKGVDDTIEGLHRLRFQEPALPGKLDRHHASTQPM